MEEGINQFLSIIPAEDSENQIDSTATGDAAFQVYFSVWKPLHQVMEGSATTLSTRDNAGRIFCASTRSAEGGRGMNRVKFSICLAVFRSSRGGSGGH